MSFKFFNDEFFVISAANSIHLLPFDEIIRFESNGIYTTAFTVDGKQHVTTKNIGTISSDLLRKKKAFFRIHKSHLVNMRKIKMVDKKGCLLLIMIDGAKLPVAARRKTELLRLFKD